MSAEILKMIDGLRSALIRFGARVARLDARVEKLDARVSKLEVR